MNWPLLMTVTSSDDSAIRETGETPTPGDGHGKCVPALTLETFREGVETDLQVGTFEAQQSEDDGDHEPGDQHQNPEPGRVVERVR